MKIFTIPLFLIVFVSAAVGESFVETASFSTKNNMPSANDTSAEIIASTSNGMTLIYSDSPLGAIGMIDISDEKNPQPLGNIMLDGEPTSVSVKNGLAYVGVNTSKSYIKPSGKLLTIDLISKKVLREVNLGGQPDSVAVSPDGSFVAVAIENERNEDINDEKIPQAPGGFLVLVQRDKLKKVSLSGFSQIAPNDPEPEFVDINNLGETVVTIQENNWLAVIDKNGDVVNQFSAGTVDLKGIDNKNDGQLKMIDNIFGVRREPDAVKWIDDDHFATANEGDYKHEAPGQAKRGGSRGWTIWNKNGSIVYDSGASFERSLASAGYWPEKRAEKKGVEPESIEVGVFNEIKMLFVGAERANAIGVYDVSDLSAPVLKQILPTGIGPEGLVAIDNRNLFVSANEVDTNKSVTIYKLK